MNLNDIIFMDTETNLVTVEQFILAVICGYKECENKTDSTLSGISVDDLFLYGRQKGFLEEQDLLNRNEYLERRNAARIVHEFLRIVCHEPEERNWKEAEVLTDLYDCKVCAKHVAQVYLKGIMPAKEKTRFQLLIKVSKAETVDIVNRMFSEETRIKI